MKWHGKISTKKKKNIRIDTHWDAHSADIRFTGKVLQRSVGVR